MCYGPDQMKKYLSRLTWPDNWTDFADLVSKTVVALVSAFLGAAIWWYTHQETALADARKDAEHQAEQKFDAKLKLIQEQLSQNSDDRDNITLFIQVLPKDDSDPLWEKKGQFLTTYCFGARPSLLMHTLCSANAEQHLRIASKSEGAASKEATAAVTSKNPAAYASAPAAGAQVSALAAVEATDLSQPSSSKWYAVIATVPIPQLEAATAVAKALNDKVGAVVGACDVHIYQTKISNNYAITSGGPKTEVDAKHRVTLIRGSGIANDAFAQPDRGWAALPKQYQPPWSKSSKCAKSR
jgi:hypothetical protein